MTDIVIASAARTPVGAFNGGLSSFPAHKLGEVAIAEALRRARVEPKEVSEVIMGQILAAGEGQNPARQAAIAAGIPFEVTAYGVNQLCGSGLRTVALGYQAIRNGDSEIVVAGGQESMSQAPHCIHLRNGVKMGDAELVDTMIRDGLWDAFNGYHMGNTAENVAQRWQITRDQGLHDAEAVRAVPDLLRQHLACRRPFVRMRRRPVGRQQMGRVLERLLDHLPRHLQPRQNRAPGARDREQAARVVGDLGQRHADGLACVDQPAFGCQRPALRHYGT